MPPCSRPSRTLRAAEAVAAKSGSSLTATAHDGRVCVQVGTEGWFQSNKRMGRSTFSGTTSNAGEPRGSMLFMFFVQRPSDDLVHWVRSIYVWNVSDAAAVSVLAASAESGYIPVMM